jgi:hypothetical protein
MSRMMRFMTRSAKPTNFQRFCVIVVMGISRSISTLFTRLSGQNTQTDSSFDHLVRCCFKLVYRFGSILPDILVVLSSQFIFSFYRYIVQVGFTSYLKTNFTYVTNAVRPTSIYEEIGQGLSKLTIRTNTWFSNLVKPLFSRFNTVSASPVGMYLVSCKHNHFDNLPSFKVQLVIGA